MQSFYVEPKNICEFKSAKMVTSVFFSQFARDIDWMMQTPSSLLDRFGFSLTY